MGALPTVELVGPPGRVVVNAGSPEEAQLRSQGYEDPIPTAKVTTPVVNSVGSVPPAVAPAVAVAPPVVPAAVIPPAAIPPAVIPVFIPQGGKPAP